MQDILRDGMSNYEHNGRKIVTDFDMKPIPMRHAIGLQRSMVTMDHKIRRNHWDEVPRKKRLYKPLLSKWKIDGIGCRR